MQKLLFTNQVYQCKNSKIKNDKKLLLMCLISTIIQTEENVIYYKKFQITSFNPRLQEFISSKQYIFSYPTKILQSKVLLMDANMIDIAEKQSLMLAYPILVLHNINNKECAFENHSKMHNNNPPTGGGHQNPKSQLHSNLVLINGLSGRILIRVCGNLIWQKEIRQSYQKSSPPRWLSSLREKLLEPTEGEFGFVVYTSSSYRGNLIYAASNDRYPSGSPGMLNERLTQLNLSNNYYAFSISSQLVSQIRRQKLQYIIKKPIKEEEDEVDKEKVDDEDYVRPVNNLNKINIFLLFVISLVQDLHGVEVNSLQGQACTARQGTVAYQEFVPLPVQHGGLLQRQSLFFLARLINLLIVQVVLVHWTHSYSIYNSLQMSILMCYSLTISQTFLLKSSYSSQTIFSCRCWSRDQVSCQGPQIWAQQ